MTKENEILAKFVGLEKSPIGHWEHSTFISEFVEDRNGFKGLRFHCSWDWLMMACKKWDDLDITGFSKEQRIEYMERSEDLDGKVTCYDILPAYMKMVENVKWLNTVLK